MVTFSELGKLGRLGNQMFQIAAVIGHAWKQYDAFMLPGGWQYSKFFETWEPCFKKRSL